MDIEEDLKEVSERFNNGTETIEDILNFCRNYEITFENGIKMRLVEKKYLDKLINEYKNVLAEREEDKKKIKYLEKENEELLEVKISVSAKNTIHNLKKENIKLEERCFMAEGNLKTTKEELRDYFYNSIPKQRVKEILDKLHISDIEPWSVYKVSGDILFNLKEMVKDK
jgi:hypothetical protein